MSRRFPALRAFSFPALLLSTLAACDQGGAPAQAAVDTTVVRAEVDSMMRQHFGSFQPGSLARWAEIMDTTVFFTAATPAEVFGSRDSLVRELEHDFAPAASGGMTLAMTPRESSTWVAPGGDAAGTAWLLDYTVTYQGTTYPYRLHAGYLLERDSAGWRVLTAQYSRPIQYDTLFFQLASHRMSGPGRVGGGIPSNAGELARQFRADIRDIANAPFASTAVAITPGSLVRGDQAARRELAQWLGPVGNATEPGDGIRAAVTGSGTVGWVATNLHVPVFAGPESAIAPMRALVFYRLVGNRWEIVQVNLSVGQRN